MEKDKSSLYYNVNAPDSRFDYSCCRYLLQAEIEYCTDDVGKYAISATGDRDYFLTPKNFEIWANGLDGKESLSECVMLFESAQQSLSAIIDKKYPNLDSKTEDWITLTAPDYKIYRVDIDLNNNICLTCIETVYLDSKVTHARIYEITIRTNNGEDLKKEADNYQHALKMAKKSRNVENYMVCIELNGERIMRWDRSNIVNKNSWRNVNVDDFETIGKLRTIIGQIK